MALQWGAARAAVSPLSFSCPVRFGTLVGRAVLPPGADEEDEENWIAPEALGGGIDRRDEIGVDRLHQMRHAVDQLKTRNPQRPEAVGHERNGDHRHEDSGIDNQVADLNCNVAAVQRMRQNRKYVWPQ